MTDIDLDAIRAREQAATSEAVVMLTALDNLPRGVYTVQALPSTWERMAKTVRTDVPALIAAVQRRDDALAAVLALCALREKDDVRDGDGFVVVRVDDVRAMIGGRP